MSRKKSLRRTIEEAKAGVQQREAGGGSGGSGRSTGRANNGSRNEGSSSDHPVGSVRAARSNGARVG